MSARPSKLPPGFMELACAASCRAMSWSSWMSCVRPCWAAAIELPAITRSQVLRILARASAKMQ